jgi:hypothetical protein
MPTTLTTAGGPVESRRGARPSSLMIVVIGLGLGIQLGAGEVAFGREEHGGRKRVSWPLVTTFSGLLGTAG